MKGAMKQASFFGSNVTGHARALSFYGFVLESYEGNYATGTSQGIEVGRFGRARFYVAFTGSMQEIRQGEYATINHRFLGDKSQRERLQDHLRDVCRQRGITYRDPHWLVLCKGDE